MLFNQILQGLVYIDGYTSRGSGVFDAHPQQGFGDVLHVLYGSLHVNDQGGDYQERDATTDHVLQAQPLSHSSANLKPTPARVWIRGRSKPLSTLWRRRNM